MELSLGFSPCPNDTFIFDALVNGKIDTGNLSFRVEMHDVQTLNEMAMNGDIDITKISYGSLPMILENYVVLHSGSALGMGVGPLLVAPFAVPAPDVKKCSIAIPGKNTTAHVLFSLAYPEATNKVFLRYNEIEDFVIGNTGTLQDIESVKLGVIIHENRFTYQDKGLVKQTDLGHFWEAETGCPVPLGGIVAKRSIPDKITHKVQELIRESLQYSYDQGSILSNFVQENAMEMLPAVIQQHIDLYVNKYTSDLGHAGMQAIRKFLQVYSDSNSITINTEHVFL